MPLPKPSKGQKKSDFISACMSNDMVKKEFPDTDQALAVCNSQWKKKKRGVEEMQYEREVRDIALEELRVTGGDGKPLRFEGYAALFDNLSGDLGGFREKIAPYAFRSAIRKSDTRALFNHDKNHVLGRKSAKTLRMKEDREGLKVTIIPPDTQWARDLAVSVERGDINQMSFGFIAKKDSWEEDKKLGAVRTLLEIERLMDVSLVTFPAYTDTRVAVRSQELWQKEEDPNEIEGEEKSVMAKHRKRLFELKLKEGT